MAIRVRRKAPDTYQHGDLKEALIQAASKLLSEGGVATLSLRAAAQLAGVSHAAPYRHFRDKDALLAAVGERGFRLLTASMRDAVARCRTPDGAARFRAIGRGYVTFARNNPAFFRVIFSGLVPDDAASPALRQAGQEAYGVLRGLVEEGIATGFLRAGNPDELALGAWSMVHGLSMLAINGQLQPWGEGDDVVNGLTDKLVGFLSEGLAPRRRA